ncbi:MAG: sugar ABC transporter permease [Clostridia bacterium]|nr:sugar ABC transporter permease [Clostridia bacterium]
MQQELPHGIPKKTKSSMGSFRRNQLIFIWSWLMPPIISFLIFGAYEKLSSIMMAFQNRHGQFSFENFEYFAKMMFNAEGDLFVALKNTLTHFSVGLFLKFPFQLLIAYLIFKKVFGYKIWRYIFYFPAIISNIAFTTVFKQVIHSEGLLGDIFAAFGWPFPANGLLGNPATVTPTVIAYGMWDSLGTQMLLFCGAMVRIPVETLESGRLDGVSASREFFQLILPMMWPTLSTILLLQITGILEASGALLLLVGDAASFDLGAHTITFWMWSQVYAGGEHMAGAYTRVCGVGLCLSIMVMPFVFFVKWIFTDVLPQVEY